MVKLPRKCFVSQSLAVELIELLLDIMAHAKNQNGGVKPLITSLTSNYPEEVATAWQRVREPVFFLNKGHLQILQYIAHQPDGCFQKLRFDLSIDEAKEVAAKVKWMCKRQLSAFCYLSNYFILSIRNLEKQGVKGQEIEYDFKAVLRQLQQLHKPAPSIYHFDKAVFGVHPS